MRAKCDIRDDFTPKLQLVEGGGGDYGDHGEGGGVEESKGGELNPSGRSKSPPKAGSSGAEDGEAGPSIPELTAERDECLAAVRAKRAEEAKLVAQVQGKNCRPARLAPDALRELATVEEDLGLAEKVKLATE